MGKLFYGVTGEGRGHATRVRTLVDQLKGEHEVVIYAPAMAYDFLAPIYANTAVTVRQIPGLLFHYNKKGQLNYARTGLASARFLLNMPSEVAKIAADMEREKPDLVITDFEPLLPRAANKCEIPYISVDHQHFLKTYDLSSLPLHLRLHAQIMSQFVGLYYRNQVESIVSSFYFPPLKKNIENVTQVGVLLREEVLNATRKHGDHLVVYLRRHMTLEIETALKASGRRVLIYGLGEQAQDANLQYCPISAEKFIEDLASCAALVSTAGNQLLGEALFLGKPALVMPEEGNREQEINGWFLDSTGAGQSIPMPEFSSNHLNHFLENLEIYRNNISHFRINGNTATLNAIRAYLPAGKARRPVQTAVYGLQAQVG